MDGEGRDIPEPDVDVEKVKAEPDRAVDGGELPGGGRDPDLERTDDGPSIDFGPGEETRLVRRLDLFILPIVMLLYLMSFLDRVNIGNARLYRLEADLGMSSEQFSTAVSVLFATYLSSEVPSNLLLKRMRPSRWISFIATAWGIIATCTGAVQSFAGLIVCRLLLGVFEGGLFPGMAVYLTLFYSKTELALRIGYLFVSAALAGAIGGLLAYAIGLLDGRHGIAGWRWIFIVEGAPTIGLGIAAWWILADEPATAYFLSPRQRRLTTLRLSRQQGYTPSATQFHWADVRLALKDWTVWAFSVALFGADTMLYGFSTFLPTIIRSIDPARPRELVQVLTIPCYALGAIAYLVVAKVSDRQQLRVPYVIGAGMVCITGYALLMADVSAGVRYAGCFLVAGGLYIFIGLPLAWLPANCPRYGKRTTATGIQLTFGNCAGILSSFLYPVDEGPRFVRGHGVTVGMISFALVVYAVLGLHFWIENGRRKGLLVRAGLLPEGASPADFSTGQSERLTDQQQPSSGSDKQMEEHGHGTVLKTGSKWTSRGAGLETDKLGPERDMRELGDRSPWFVYTY